MTGAGKIIKMENRTGIIFLTADKQLCTAVQEYLKTVCCDHVFEITSDLSLFSEKLLSGKVIIALADTALGDVYITQALAILKSIDQDLPLILITNKDKQEKAAGFISSGASDYVTTDNLIRLCPVIKREVKGYKEIVEGKKAKQEIKELQNIINSAEDEIYVLDGADFRITFANRKASFNLKYPEDKLKKMFMNEIMTDVMPVGFMSGWDKFKSRKTFYTRMKRSDGTVYPAEAVFQSVKTDGKTAILGIIHDITEKESAKQQAMILNKAIDASASSVIITDNDYKIFYVNKAYCTMTGKSRSDAIGADILGNIVSNEKKNDFRNALKNCGGGQSWVGEYNRLGRDGEEYVVLGSVSPVLNERSELQNIVIVEEDITERLRIKSQLMHAQKMETVGELTSGIAHDFTNMLTAIGGFASIMKRKMEPESSFYMYVDKIVELTIRAKSLTQNLLTFSRKQMQSERVLNLNDLVDTVSGFLSMVIGNKLEIRKELSPEEINIIGDPVQLEQVIINLATNARDAVTKDGILTISTDRLMISSKEAGGGFKEYAVISVKDNGSGIDDKKLKKIFEPFYTTKEEGKGTGLGLYIVSDIINRHHGMIECQSEIGVGTEFIIKLPVTEKKPEETKEEIDVKSTKSAVILLIEDEKMVRESLMNALDAYGYKVIEAANGKEALDIYKKQHGGIDLVISDIVMPVMDGIEAYSQMSAVNPDVKMIFTTGYVGETHKRDNFDESEHVVLLKPLLVKELIKRIEQLIAKN
ncbi:ATP-binding protein [Seleniivibrio sp.]|uniref:ATP-binding protein n=1 Tax=Seleniivibrio sp. TaxID=2898801 RepID=UPI0025DAC566|nr:ATP-binding protein [Seleniivibrio sp.]MCD8553882.1 PAS domain S-box protein [Seleniivibrio sp.]